MSRFPRSSSTPGGEPDLARLGVEVVHEERGVIAPVIADGEYRRRTRVENLVVAPADFRHFLAHANDALGPVEQGVRIAALLRGVDILVSVGTVCDHRTNRLVALRESRVGLRRPLHRRAHRIALGQAEIVAHAELVAVAHDRRAGQREHQAVRELEAPAIAFEHRREPPPDAAVIELHVLLRPEGGEHRLPLAFREPPEVELVVIAQEDAPLRGGGTRFRRLERFRERAESAAASA